MPFCYQDPSMLGFSQLLAARRLSRGLPKLWYLEPRRQGRLLALSNGNADTDREEKTSDGQDFWFADVVLAGHCRLLFDYVFGTVFHAWYSRRMMSIFWHPSATLVSYLYECR